ncbi:unnamed protein product [Amoebophrya sp. A25]|nr:unnamed protein product [Amoebophrya sp. A25]|eukprot:GSA25T00021308001.1
MSQRPGPYSGAKGNGKGNAGNGRPKRQLKREDSGEAARLIASQLQDGPRVIAPLRALYRVYRRSQSAVVAAVLHPPPPQLRCPEQQSTQMRMPRFSTKAKEIASAVSGTRIGNLLKAATLDEFAGDDFTLMESSILVRGISQATPSAAANLIGGIDDIAKRSTLGDRKAEMEECAVEAFLGGVVKGNSQDNSRGLLSVKVWR